MRRFLSKAFILLLLLVGSKNADAQQFWAMATMENEQTKPVVCEYHSLNEKGTNGVDYMRIFDDGFRFRKEPYNPVKTQFGYRMQDKKIFIYDYNKDEERLAFDFELSAGESFTTYNGLEWIVEEVKDTFIHISPMETCDADQYKLLKVRSVDGKWTDQWLENFGSFTNHFMIKSMDEVRLSQALWMEYDYGEYIAREFSADPLFGHDTGRRRVPLYDESEVCSHEETYSDSTLTVEDVRFTYARRDYICFYREGDMINTLYSWEFEPQEENTEDIFMCKDVMVFRGLPKPIDSYLIDIYAELPTTESNSILEVSTKNEEPSIYDLQGRRIMYKPTNGIYIQQGRKILVK